MLRYGITLISFFFCLNSFSATINIRLIINGGVHNLTGGATVDAKTFSTSLSFSENSDLFIWNQGDDVNLKVVNLDTEIHGFVIDGYADYGIIAVGDSVEQNIVLTNNGVFRYYDPSNSPYNEYLGLSGIIHIKAAGDNASYFYWDIREIEAVWNPAIIAGGSPVLTDYNPEYFTINGNSNPDINADPVARVVGNVGVEFKIVMVNNGQSIHSMHFHGYHLTIEADSKSSITLGRSKDTFPLYPSEHLIISCIPDKVGEYPVHDHNLVAVTGGQLYATGMFTTQLISP